MSPPQWDCVVAGGGPAGLSAALVLGRALRRVLVCDAGEPRNRHSEAAHGYLTRDGIAPGTFLALGRAELARYGTVEYQPLRVEDAVRTNGGFELKLSNARRVRSRTVLVATGIVDTLPRLEGIEALYGRSVHHCPYCDGWEHRNSALAAYGPGEAGARLALKLRQWSPDIMWCADGNTDVQEDVRSELAAAGVVIRGQRVRRLEGRDGRLERIVLDGVPPVERSALFVLVQQRQGSPLAERLGCRLNEKGTVETGTAERTEVPGVFVAGDASKDAQFLIVAAAEGAQAAVAIDTLLARQDRQAPTAVSIAG
jgi:thioredoxin reductase